MITLRPEVQKFAELMELELRKHDDIKPGWKHNDPYTLVNKAKRHLFKFWSNWNKKVNIESLIHAANYLMMAVDICLTKDV